MARSKCIPRAGSSDPWEYGWEEDELVRGEPLRDAAASWAMDDFFLRNTLRAGFRLLSYDRPEDEEPEPLCAWAPVRAEAAAEIVVLVEPHDCDW